MPTNNTNNTDMLSKENLAHLEAVKPLAMALTADSVKAPDIPMAVFLTEGRGFVMAAREHQQALQAVGMPVDLIDSYEQRLMALDVAQALWNRQQNKGRDEVLNKTINNAYALRGETLAAADLALRNSQDGQRRLANIREGEGLADLVADLRDLSVLVREAATYFTAIKASPNEMVTQLESTEAELQQGLAHESVQKSLCIEKEQRDRYYTLCLEPLREMRAFADFAFRKDEGNTRRFAFTSAYDRKARRRHARNARAAAMAAAAAIVENATIDQ